MDTERPKHTPMPTYQPFIEAAHRAKTQHDIEGATYQLDQAQGRLYLHETEHGHNRFHDLGRVELVREYFGINELETASELLDDISDPNCYIDALQYWYRLEPEETISHMILIAKSYDNDRHAALHLTLVEKVAVFAKHKPCDEFAQHVSDRLYEYLTIRERELLAEAKSKQD